MVTKNDKNRLIDGIIYQYGLLVFCKKQLDKQSTNYQRKTLTDFQTQQWNCYLETFLLCCRRLYHFAHNHGNHSDDVIAEHYTKSEYTKNKFPSSKLIENELNKKAIHLTYTPKGKWVYDQYFIYITTCIDHFLFDLKISYKKSFKPLEKLVLDN